MSAILVLDLETVLDLSLPAPPEASADEKKAGKKAPFPPPPLHRVICAGWAILDSAYCVEEWGVMGDKDESELIIVSRLIGVIDSLDPVIVTMGGRQFDLPVLAARAFVYGLSFAWYYRTKYGARYRYSLADTFDVQDYLSDHGAAPRSTVHIWSNACGWPGKPEGVSGSSVEEMVSAGKLEAVYRYCLGDVCEETAIFLRTELLRGAIGLDTYRTAATCLLEKAEGDPRTAALAFAVDRARFLCDPSMNDRREAI